MVLSGSSREMFDSFAERELETEAVSTIPARLGNALLCWQTFSSG
jgi:hypothetical protein